MEITFTGKRALVTGGSRGIGRGVALALAKGGAETITIGTSQKDLESLKQENPSIITHVLDLSDWNQTRKLMESLVTEAPIDLLVNNAGISKLDKFVDVNIDDYERIHTVNVKAVINVSQVLAKAMIDSGKGGAIVNVSSVASFMALKNHTSYCSSKAAIDSITKTMALELGHLVRVNSVNPTVVLTDMAKEHWGDPKVSAPVLERIPRGRFLEVEDVVNTILFLLSDKSAMLNGVILPMDGGLSIH